MRRGSALEHMLRHYIGAQLHRSVSSSSEDLFRATDRAMHLSYGPRTTPNGAIMPLHGLLVASRLLSPFGPVAASRSIASGAANNVPGRSDAASPPPPVPRRRATAAAEDTVLADSGPRPTRDPRSRSSAAGAAASALRAVQQRHALLREWAAAYYAGDALVTDAVYDQYASELAVMEGKLRAAAPPGDAEVEALLAASPLRTVVGAVGAGEQGGREQAGVWQPFLCGHACESGARNLILQQGPAALSPVMRASLAAHKPQRNPHPPPPQPNPSPRSPGRARGRARGRPQGAPPDADAVAAGSAGRGRPGRVGQAPFASGGGSRGAGVRD
jgi:hypothetical protein